MAWRAFSPRLFPNTGTEGSLSRTLLTTGSTHKKSSDRDTTRAHFRNSPSAYGCSPLNASEIHPPSDPRSCKVFQNQRLLFYLKLFLLWDSRFVFGRNCKIELLYRHDSQGRR